jgi:hypothetical protein
MMTPINLRTGYGNAESKLGACYHPAEVLRDPHEVDYAAEGCEAVHQVPNKCSLMPYADVIAACARVFAPGRKTAACSGQPPGPRPAETLRYRILHAVVG